jgi:hypothetical protein
MQNPNFQVPAKHVKNSWWFIHHNYPCNFYLADGPEVIGALIVKKISWEVRPTVTPQGA